MRRLAILLLAGISITLGQQHVVAREDPAPNPVAVARRFLPPNSYLASLYSFSFRLGKVTKRWPAVLTCHILSPESEDIVFAYFTPHQIHRMAKTLFVAVLHKEGREYQEVYVVSYRDQVLLVPNAIRILHLRGLETDTISVIAGIGADLGGQLWVFLWREPWGWENVFPSNGSMHYFYFFPENTKLDIALSASKHPGLNVTPPPVWYRWNGERFVKIAPPKGSSKWPLPN